MAAAAAPICAAPEGGLMRRSRMTRTRVSSNTFLVVAVVLVGFFWFGPGWRWVYRPTSMSARGTYARVRHPMADERSRDSLAVPPVEMLDIEDEWEDDGKGLEGGEDFGQDDEQQSANSWTRDPLPCVGLQGADDVVLIIKTGSTEALEKLPVHFRTTAHCYKHHLIFSDFGEVLEGHTIHDALDLVTEDIRIGDDSFELWRRLKDGGRGVLDQSDLSSSDYSKSAPPYGNMSDGKWRLDKMKFLPMIGKTLKQVPNAKWYVFTDADTYIIQSNLLQWVQRLNPENMVYMGNPTAINGQLFAHGGSGYILSSAAMHAAAAEYEANQERWDHNASAHWAGDCVLGALLQEIGVELVWAFPMIQERDPTVRDWQEIGYDKKLWCYPAVSYHLAKSETIDALFAFEQAWIAGEEGSSNAGPIRHSDVFKMWIQPQLLHEKEGWDDASNEPQEGQPVDSALACRAVCEDIRHCFQYSYGSGVCKTATTPRLGAKSKDEDIVSGWMLGRIHKLTEQLDQCGDQGDWILP